MVAKSCRYCGTVCAGPVCDECGAERRRVRERARNRPSAARRGYGADYRRNRRVVIDQAKRGRPCVICGNPFTAGELVTAEHIVPLRRGGGNSPGNLGPAHLRCNSGWNRTT